MFKNELAVKENTSTYGDGSESAVTTIVAYEVYIEKILDKDKKPILNKDGSEKYRAIEDNDIFALESDLKVKKIDEYFYKKIYEVNGDLVEKVERNGKKFYYVVEEEKIVTLPAGSKIYTKGDYYKIPNELGYALVDESVEGDYRIIRVRQFKTEDHKAEAEEIVRTSRYQHRED